MIATAIIAVTGALLLIAVAITAVSSALNRIADALEARTDLPGWQESRLRRLEEEDS